MLARSLATLSLALLASAPLAGCGDHDHVRDNGNYPGSAKTLGADQERAADLIVRDIGAYLSVRTSAPPGAGGANVALDRLKAEDAALEGLLDAGEAMRIASHAEELIVEDEPDAGRAARVKGSAAQVRATAQRVQASAQALLRTIETSTPGVVAASELESDRTALRAALRAMKVDVIAMEREAS